MSIQITSYPPLGQITRVESDKVTFTVILESDSKHDWKAQVWHSSDRSEWSALPLQKCPATAVPLLSGHEESNRLIFSEELSHPESGSVRFTVRYRDDPSEEWKWANTEQSVGDGEIIFTPTTILSPTDFAKYFDNLSPEITVESRKSEAPGAQLWHLSGPIGSATDHQPGTANLPLGTPSSVSRFFALVRLSTPWLGPRQGKDQLVLKEDAILCSFLRDDGVHVVTLGVSGVDDVLTVFGSGSDGQVVIKSKNDNPQATRFQVLAAAAAADEFEIAMSALMYEARKIVRPYGIADEPKVQWLSSWCDGLTYCTWNGIGQDLTERKILSALDELKSQKIKISGLIIDDNWQSLDNEGGESGSRGWLRFEANPKAFPQGLRKTISTIRELHPDIGYIAVWHALLGYWGGISPDGELAATYKTKEIQINNSAKKSILAIDPDDIQRFYNDFYRFLFAAGITGVKTDAQSFLDLISDPTDRKRVTTAYQDAWSVSSLRAFGPKVISCMSLLPQTIFHSQLPTNKPTIVVRNSDDFFPDIEDSHAWHVFCNAHNALLTRYLNTLPDWDMFQTSHPYAAFHAAARCISGGPIYITDIPGQHDMTILKQITAPTIQETTIILRPSLVGRTLDMYHDINEGHVLRIGSYTGRARTGSGIIGLFNVSPDPKQCIIPVIDFPGIYTSEGGDYIVRAHTTGKIAESLQSTSTFSVTLQKRGWEIVTAYPAYSFTVKDNPAPTQLAVLGLLGKMTGVAALVGSDIYVESNGRLRITVGLKALGILGIYISDLPQWDVDAHFMIMISGKPVPRKTVWIEDGKILAVDIAQAWSEMGLQAGWGNEVLVSVLLG